MALALSVVVPSYRRPVELARCLDAVAASSRSPDETIVALRPEDVDGRAVAAAAGARIVDVTAPGHLPPLIAALCDIRGDVMVVFDDDAVPRSDCLSRVERAFGDPRVVAVGGPIADPDASVGSARDAERRLQGLCRGGRTWYRGFEGLPRAADYAARPGPITRPVDHLSGGNMALRTETLRRVGFDLALNRGAAIGWESDICLGLRRLGVVLFDPLLVVDHYRAPRSAPPTATPRHGTRATTAGISSTSPRSTSRRLS